MNRGLNDAITFSVRMNEFGLFEFTVNNGWTRIPGFLRPPRGAEEARGGLARQTTIGNFHGPFVEELGGGMERLVLDQRWAAEALRVIWARGYHVV